MSDQVQERISSQSASAAVPRIWTPVTLQAPARGFLFANNIRFLSMAAIVFIHCIQTACQRAGVPSTSLLQLCLIQPFKFGTIDFFLISGFLMGDRLSIRQPAEYFMRRVHNILPPWLFWASIYCSIILVPFLLFHLPRSGSLLYNLLSVPVVLYVCIFRSPYWFVPNLLLALWIILHCVRFLSDLRLGCILMACSLFYGLNMYAHWMPSISHTDAMFGFIFYIWLGAWARRHLDALQSVMARIPSFIMFSLAAVTGLVAIYESYALNAAGDPYAMSTLRVSNQLYSIIVALALFKVLRPISPRALNVRTSTFGIYLIHTVAFVLLDMLVQAFCGATVGPIAGSQAFTAIVLSLGFFTATYGASLALTVWILRYPQLHWMVGVSVQGKTMHLR
jgi:hypothetical protein